MAVRPPQALPILSQGTLPYTRSCPALLPEFVFSQVVTTMRNEYIIRLVSEKGRRKVWEPKSLRCFTCLQVGSCSSADSSEEKSGCNLCC